MPAPITGQATCTGVNAAVGLSPVPVSASAFTIKAPATNGSAVAIGGSAVTTATGYLLDPGGEMTYTRNTQNAEARFELGVADFYVAGNALDLVSWLASP